MAIEKYLGKIGHVELGFTDTDVLAVTFHLEAGGFGTFLIWYVKSSDFHSRLDTLMRQAKVSDFNKLKNAPIEMEIDNGALKSWRILEEVL